jgi:hypothetical protein
MKNAQEAIGNNHPLPPCSADFVMSFGKYKGQTLNQISDIDTGYILWLDDERVLTIEPKFLEAVRRDDMAITTYGDEWAFRYE